MQTGTIPGTAPIALWRIAESFLHILHSLFGAPEDVARDHTLTRAAHALLVSWLRVGEALLRLRLERRSVTPEIAGQPSHPHRPAGSTTSATTLRTSGSTKNSVGSAMIHDTSHAVGQAEKNSALGPRFFTVATAETIIDITIESANGITIAA
jgi:hypothetical protein